MLRKLAAMFKNREVRNRIIFTLVILFIFKLGSTITVPRVDITNVNIQDTADIFGLMNTLGGGALKHFSLFSLGVTPYITASIVVSLLAMGVLPKLTELAKQGAQGRKKMNDVTRALTVLLAAVQGYGVIVTMQNQYGLTPIRGSFTFWDYVYIIVVIMAGTFLLMWLADQITAKGVGNGVSIIICAGILMELPYQIVNAYSNFVGLESTSSAIFNGVIKFAVYLLAYVLMILFIIFTERSTRKVPIQYAAQTFQARTSSDVTYLPIRINSAGVIPVIFASSLMTAPTIVMNFVGVSPANPIYAILSISTTYKGVPWGLIIYAILIIVFTFLYTFLQIDPETMSANFQKSGAYIPGVRPGKETEKYITKVLTRVTVFGAICLTLIAIAPMILTMFIDLPSSIAFGGTGLIIVVGVILETAREIDGRLAARRYQGFVVK